MPSYKDALLGSLAALLAIYVIVSIVTDISLPDLVSRGSSYKTPPVKYAYTYVNDKQWNIVIVIENTHCCSNIVVTNILINNREISYYNASVEPKLPYIIPYGEQAKIVVRVPSKEFSPGQIITVTIVLGGYSQQYVIKLQ